MHPKANLKLKRLIRRHVNAQIDLAFKGASHPDDWEYIEQEAADARRKLYDFINLLKDNPKP